MLRGLYSSHGTHARPWMTKQQKEKAKRWEKPSILVALLVAPILICRAEKWFAAVADYSFIFLVVFLLAEAFSIIRAYSFKGWLKQNPLDLIILVGCLASLPWVTSAAWDWCSVVVLLRILDLLPWINRRIFKVTPMFFAISMLLIVMLMGALSFVQIEHPSPGKDYSLMEGFYWASTTVSTVGYGDIYPHTNEGMVMTILLQLSGLVVGALLVAAAVQMFNRQFAKAFMREFEGTDDDADEDADPLDRK